MEMFRRMIFIKNLSSCLNYYSRKSVFIYFFIYQVIMYLLYTQTYLIHDELEKSLVLIEETNIWFLAGLVIIIAPIIEEFIFRRVVFNFFLRINMVAAILASSLGWAFVHFSSNPIVFFMLFFLGIILAITRIESKEIKFSILLHAINNAFFLFILKVFYI
tara:strand:+ start:1962 stop:2444 length:483 start_codon:yes stop_codon:yes gene_type:complete